LIAGLLKVLTWKPPSFLVGTSTSRFEAGQLCLAQTERWVSSFENLGGGRESSGERSATPPHSSQFA
jgi:hypothetical protein